MSISLHVDSAMVQVKFGPTSQCVEWSVSETESLSIKTYKMFSFDSNSYCVSHVLIILLHLHKPAVTFEIIMIIGEQS